MTNNLASGLRVFDDATLLDMYDHAHEIGDAHCDAIAAELNARGIAVKPCGHPHALGDYTGADRDGG